MEEPVLLQRKLKHLVSISLKNISTIPDYHNSSITSIINHEDSSTATSRNTSSTNLNKLGNFNFTVSDSNNLYECFFTLTELNEDFPFYISEKKINCLNIDFNDINLTNIEYKHALKYENLLKLRTFKLKVFIRKTEKKKSNWEVLIYKKVKLNDLIYLGKNLNPLKKSYKNQLLIVLIDGVYELPIIELKELRKKLKKFSVNNNNKAIVNKEINKNPVNGIPMMSFNTVLELNNLKLCISDVKKINNQLQNNINLKLKEREIERRKKHIEIPIELNERMLLIRCLKYKNHSYLRVIDSLKKINYSLSKKLNNKTEILNSLKLLIYDDMGLKNNIEEITEESEEEDSGEDPERTINKITFKYDDENDENEIENEDQDEEDDNNTGEANIENLNDSIKLATRTRSAKRNKMNSLILSIDSKIMIKKATYSYNNEKLSKKLYEINMGISSIFKTLIEIFPIKPIETNSVEFSLFDLTLTNLCYFIRFPKYNHHHHHHHRKLSNDSTKDEHNEEIDLDILSKDELKIEIDTVLGYVGQLVELISLYLQIPLKYPIVKFGSYSYICDYVSNLKDNNKIFPIFLNTKLLNNYNSNILFKFEYGVSLLIKNIEQLMNCQNLQVPDSRNILGNLKMLMLYLASKDLP